MEYSIQINPKCKVPVDFEKRIIDQIIQNDERYMKHRELCLSLIESWLNTNSLCDYDYDLLTEYVNDWFDDFAGDWFIKNDLSS